MSDTNTQENAVETVVRHVPLSRQGLALDEKYEATVMKISEETFSNGNMCYKFMLNISKEDEQVVEYLYYNISSDRGLQYTMDQLEKAFDLTDLLEIESLVGKQCSVSMKTDAYKNGAVVVGYLNNINNKASHAPFNTGSIAERQAKLKAAAAAAAAEPVETEPVF
jgi:hypothetical protein